ncbi:MAG: hypothetical protein A3F94_03250 [Candidatus Spechtbacteria bacterium RIFCSPLOWO2_12_FULL_38_22]|uniref:Uncharacterized protein n=1 Tax=Candidatus Spechtbacteria bacterium RIFCSPLOWO2_12_FULL_38_22 TaxID=1802165 RepID=A0A1G2HIL9_9BACT|nr:MAG: hypothetical protein A3E58_00410 [Candidatus Spechtbacteria bacterium RIFCSPHIGHO2_12_FULL_38_30]OGZ60243.1 MAG: hypothetical protein A3A00_00080 [Candidatus Spechtbacteria bacterium RIFCSPLOWO2_01_FULL_38_20]OGZ62344.1 MAG: hypothetical protein A3F94_03250 [Candidatus Spechtbacteria bacterium RIFCSPLOWO2_12_FULL_38_22]
MPENEKIVPQEVLGKKRDIKQLTEKLVDFGDFSVLEGLDSQDVTQIVIRLIKDHKADFFFQNSEYFYGVDGEEVIKFLAEQGGLMYYFAKYIVDALRIFENVNQRKVLDELIKRELWSSVARVLDLGLLKFKLDNWIVEELLQRDYLDVIVSSLDRIEDVNDLLSSDTNFLSILEGVYRGVAMYTNYNGTQLLETQDYALNKIEFLLSADVVKNDPVKILYIVRMFLLFPHKYLRVAELAKNMGGLVASLFEKYQPHTTDLASALGKLRHSESQIDTEKPSYNLEIEAMNIDVEMELNTPITNDISLIVNFVKKLDEVQKQIYEEMKQHIKDSSDEDRQVVGVYDSVHINIGIPGGEETLANLSQDIKSREGIYFLLELIGIIYNSIGRVAFMYRRQYAHLIEINKNEDEGESIEPGVGDANAQDQDGNPFPVKLGYTVKLQNRLWGFNLTADNAPMLEVLLRYMDKLIKHYKLDTPEARKRVGEVINDIMEFIKQKQEETLLRIGKGTEESSPVTYGELVRKGFNELHEWWAINMDELLKGVFPGAYLLDRNEILRFIMKRLSDEIKAPLV